MGVREFIKGFSANAELLEYTHSDPRLLDRPFETFTRFKAPAWALSVANVLVIKPDLRQSLGQGSSNPFTRATRHFPIQFSRSSRTLARLTITLPDGYETLDMPSSSNMENEFLVRRFELNREDRVVRIEKWSRFKDATFPATRYAEIRSLFTRLDELDRRLIVLRAAGGP